MILVAGATGNIGGEIVRALLGRGEAVRAIVRKPSADLPDGVESVVADLDEPDSLAPAVAGASAAFLLPGYRDMPGVLEEARRAGVQRVVQLSGSSAEGGDTSNAISRYMIASEAAVRDSGVPATILRPSGFMSNTLQWRPQLRAGDTIAAPFADALVAMIDPYDIAAVAAAALSTDAHVGEVYRLSGPEPLAPADRVAVLGDVLGRRLRFEAQPNERAREEMSESMPAEYVDAFFRFYAEGELDESTVLSTVEDITGRPARTFEQWARAHATDFE